MCPQIAWSRSLAAVRDPIRVLYITPSSHSIARRRSHPTAARHARHGAVDNTFAQFYPTLLPAARERRALRAER